MERALLPCLLAAGILVAFGHASEIVNNQINTATCAIRSYDGCIQAEKPVKDSPSQHRYFSVDAG